MDTHLEHPCVVSIVLGYNEITLPDILILRGQFNRPLTLEDEDSQPFHKTSTEWYLEIKRQLSKMMTSVFVIQTMKT